MNLEPLTYRMLDISTAHITLEASQWLDSNLNSGRAVIGSRWAEYGWILWVPNDEECAQRLREEVALPDSLATVLRFAQEHGFDYVKLDCDAEVCEALPTYEW